MNRTVNPSDTSAYRACSSAATTFDEALACTANETAKITACSESLLDRFWAGFPDAKVMQCGYDVPCMQDFCAHATLSRAPFCGKQSADGRGV